MSPGFGQIVAKWVNLAFSTDLGKTGLSKCLMRRRKLGSKNGGPLKILNREPSSVASRKGRGARAVTQKSQVLQIPI